MATACGPPYDRCPSTDPPTESPVPLCFPYPAATTSDAVLFLLSPLFPRDGVDRRSERMEMTANIMKTLRRCDGAHHEQIEHGS